MCGSYFFIVLDFLIQRFQVGQNPGFYLYFYFDAEISTRRPGVRICILYTNPSLCGGSRVHSQRIPLDGPPDTVHCEFSLVSNADTVHVTFEWNIAISRSLRLPGGGSFRTV
jgi:hypothetical protein